MSPVAPGSNGLAERSYKCLEGRQGTSGKKSAGSGDPLAEGDAVEEGGDWHPGCPVRARMAESTLCWGRGAEGVGASPGVPDGGSGCEPRAVPCSASGLGLQGWGECPMRGVAGVEGRAVFVVLLGLPAGSWGSFYFF